MIRILCVIALAVLLAPACATSDCIEQSCTGFGGSPNRTFLTCVSSGSGSVDDLFTIEDASGDEVYRCTRPADDNDGCGVELIRAKSAYCAAGASGSGSGSGGGGSE